MQTAFDLHRFDLLQSLHLPLPSDRTSEIAENTKLSDFLRQGLPFRCIYEHPAVKVQGRLACVRRDPPHV
jgi:hypothetical protein